MTQKFPSIPNPFDLTDRVAMITGGSGLLGLQHAEALLNAGASVAIFDIRTPESSEGMRNLISRFPDRVLAVKGDITSEVSVAECLQAVLAQF